MAITTAMANSFKADLLTGTHVAADVYKIALYTDVATLSAATTVYSVTNEAAGTGYTAGGKILTSYTGAAAGAEAWIDWADPVWSAATITARGCMIYNSSKSNKCVAVYDFGSNVTSTAADFTVTMPAPAAGTAVVRIV